jgi:glycosyltransferase involved in cell wall biosynthesis
MSDGKLIDLLKEKARAVLSIAPKIGLVPKASSFRKKGISAFIRVRNEEYWIQPCILSIDPYVDEILIIDNGSTDATFEVVKAVSNEISTPVRIFFRPNADHCEVSNIGIKESKYNWLLKWDADFIAHTDGNTEFGYLRDYVLGLDQSRYYMIFLNLVNLAGDLWHQPRESCTYIRSPGLTHKEAYLWNYSPKMRYVWKDFKGISKVESLLFPPFYRFIEWPQYNIFHVGGIRSIGRMLVDHFWYQWKKQYAGKPENDRIISRENFAWEKAKMNFKGDNEDKILRHFFHKMKDELILYNPKKFGAHPNVLLSYLKDPKYKILYNENDQIIGRIPDCIWKE